MTNPTGTQWETALLNKLTNNGERIAVVEKEVRDVKEIVSNINERLEKIDEQFDGVDKRFNDVDQRFNDVDKSLGNLDERLSEIEKLPGWLKVIGAGVITIALSLIANFIYSFLAL